MGLKLLLFCFTITLFATAPVSNKEPEKIEKKQFKDPVKSLFSGDLFLQDRSAIEAFQAERSFTPDPEHIKRYNPQKSLWIPYLETLGANLALGSYNQYIMDEEFAQIDFDTIKTNFERGWHWDTDGLYTNMFLHPFQGSIYYNTARSSGYGYFASFLVTLFGSVQWEYFMENQPPSINDLVMTTFAGALFGEAFHRISTLFLDDSDTGLTRFTREVVWSPMNLPRVANRLIYGRSTRTVPYPLYKREPYMMSLSLGVNNVADGLDFRGGSRYSYGKVEFIYGNILRQSTYKPMDFFSFVTEVEHAFSFSWRNRLRRLQIDGVIYGKQNDWGKHRLIYGFHQYADYMKNNIYQVGGYTLGGGIFYSYFASSKNIFIASVKAGWMPMGAANSDYAVDHIVDFFEEEPGREYNVGIGASFRYQIAWSIHNWLLSAKYYFWWVHTLDGADGDEVIGMFLPSIQVYIFKRWYINLQYLLYHRRGFYDDYKDVDLRNNEQRLNIGFQF